MLWDRYAHSIQKYDHLKETSLPFVCWLSSHIRFLTLNPPSFGFLSDTDSKTFIARKFSFCSVTMNALATIRALKWEKANTVQEKLVASQSLMKKKLVWLHINNIMLFQSISSSVHIVWEKPGNSLVNFHYMLCLSIINCICWHCNCASRQTTFIDVNISWLIHFKNDVVCFAMK